MEKEKKPRARKAKEAKTTEVFQVIRLKMIKEECASYGANQKIHAPNDIFPIAAHYIGDEDREHCVAFMLNTKNEVIGVHTVAIGTIDAAIVHPREVFKAALMNNAAHIILAHNHPSGSPMPSSADIELTNRMIDAGNLIGIELLDHVIVGHGACTSLREKGLCKW